MSLRFLVMLIFVTPFCVYLGLKRPLWGLYSLVVMYYFRPGVWQAPGWFQPVLWTSVACIIGWAVRARDLRITPTLVTAITLVGTMCVSSFAAFKSSEASWDCTVIILKLVTVMFLIIQLVRDIPTLLTFLWMNIIGNLWTLKTVLVMTAAQADVSRVDVGAGQGGGANYLAMLFVMGLPLFFFRYLNGSRLEKRAATILAPLYVVAVAGTGSRGGFLTLFAIMGYLIMFSNRKVAGFSLMALLLIFVIIITPEEKFARFSTTFKASNKRDFAAQSRIELWKAGWKMFNESPVVGVGHDNFQELSPRYAGFFSGDTYRPYAKEFEGRNGYGGFVAHSIWIQILADGGILGALPFFALIIISFATLAGVRKYVLLPQDKKEIAVYSRILEGILIAFFLASTFGSHFKIDFLWWYFGAVSALGLIAKRKARELRLVLRRQMTERQYHPTVASLPAGVTV